MRSFIHYVGFPNLISPGAVGGGGGRRRQFKGVACAFEAICLILCLYMWAPQNAAQLRAYLDMHAHTHSKNIKPLHIQTANKAVIKSQP